MLMFSSCDETKKQQAGEQEERTDTVCFVKSEYKNSKKLSDAEYPKYDINIEVEYADSMSVLSDTINRQLAVFLFNNGTMPFEKTANSFGDSIAQEYESELKEFYDKDNEYQDTFAYEYTQKGKVTDNPLPGTIGYSNHIAVYEGGAHGGALLSYINFNATTGAAITCEQVFGTNHEEVLNRIRNQIVKDYECQTKEELEEKTSIFSLGDVYVTDNNFLLQADGVEFCYNPYEIAPWSEGMIFTKLTYEQLEGCITLPF